MMNNHPTFVHKTSYLQRVIGSLIIAALCCQVLFFSPVLAEEKKSGTPYRAWGIAFLSGGIYMAKKGYDFTTEGNDIFKQYKNADTSGEADRLFDRASHQDIKSQISWSIAAALIVSAARLLFLTSESDTHPEKRQIDGTNKAITQKPRILLNPQITKNRLGIQLQHHFF